MFQQENLEQLKKLLKTCRLCPQNCQVNRYQETGICGVGARLKISSYGPHFGEEACLVGCGGSGTIFFSGCNLKCLFCQNYEISQWQEGYEVSEKELAEIMLNLQARGCHNINLVSPTHFTPQIAEALYLAKKEGLKVPVVYNSGGYERVAVLRLLEGLIDIYMPDFKYADDKISHQLSQAKNYFTVAKQALKEMHRQVGDLQINSHGIATKGLLVRHLVLPGGLAGSEKVFTFLKELSPHTFVNIMDQYRPCYQAFQRQPLDRAVTAKEFNQVLNLGQTLGLRVAYC